MALTALIYFYFVLASTVLKRARTARLKELSGRDRSSIRYARIVLIQGEKQLTTAQVGLFLSTLLLGFTLFEFIHVVVNLIASQIFSENVPLWTTVVGSVVFLILTLVFLLLAQVAKSIAHAGPERMLVHLARPMITSSRILNPIVSITSGLTGLLLGTLGLKRPALRESAISAQEISDLVELSSEAGQIEEEEKEMIQGVFNFADTIVREVMTPRSDIVSVQENIDLEQLLEVFAQERLSRVLVTGEVLDDVKGVLHAKDLIQWAGERSGNFELKKLIRKPFFVPNNKKISEVLQELRTDGVHLAVVVDEHGGVDGVVTMEDLIEEIVGEIRDEYDSPLEERKWIKTRSGDVIADGGALIDELNAHFRLDLPVGEYDTLAGLVTKLLGRIPEQGESVHAGITRLRVEEVNQNRISRIRILNPRRALVRGLEAKNAAPSSPSDPGALENKAAEGPRARISNLS
ncbi:MAG: hemolysin family protein [Oligoflexia bacterium]|nr:hemolysin family protein [Oligoflexia bacterium]